jgi:hypothetical protein
MNDVAADTAARAIPPFFFHYIIVFLVVVVILCICVLKFKYLYWYDQALTFRFTLRRFFRGSGGRHRTSIMNSLSLGERCYNAVVYSFLHHVNHDAVQVFHGIDENVPFERISQLLNDRSKSEGILHKNAGLISGDSSDTLRLILSQETFGLSAFIGVYYGDKCNHNTRSVVIKGVSVLTPRIMISFDSSLSMSSYKSVSIYMSEYLAWNKYTMSERESLELIETTEYIQKSREIAGEQTLYRYCEIPWFVIPFSTVYSYVFKIPSVPASARSGFGHGITVIPVSSANFALFYAFVNEHTRDFKTCILNEITQLQSLVEHGLYLIYMLMLNNTRVLAVYLFTDSSSASAAAAAALMNEIQVYPAGTAGRRNKKKTKGNRIADLHEYVSSTSTALVKYLPPVIRPKYDAFGKRISTTTQTTTKIPMPRESVVMRLVSSIQDKTICETSDFLRGFQYICERNRKGLGMVVIDTLAHNHRIIDPLVMIESVSWPLVTKDKWYYILYNAIIHEETLCKDILMI